MKPPVIHSIEIPPALLVAPALVVIPDPATATAADFARFTLDLSEALEGYECRFAAIRAIVAGVKPVKC